MRWIKVGTAVKMTARSTGVGAREDLAVKHRRDAVTKRSRSEQRRPKMEDICSDERGRMN